MQCPEPLEVSQKVGLLLARIDFSSSVSFHLLFYQGELGRYPKESDLPAMMKFMNTDSHPGASYEEVLPSMAFLPDEWLDSVITKYV